MEGIASSEDEARACAKPVVLVVEDDVLVRLLAADYLRGAGFTVLEAVSAEEAVVVIGSRVAVDLVFTDHNMSGQMSGQSLALWLADHCPAPPVIITSGTVQPASGDRSDRRFIMKPYQLPDVERHIRDLLR